MSKIVRCAATALTACGMIALTRTVWQSHFLSQGNGPGVKVWRVGMHENAIGKCAPWQVRPAATWNVCEQLCKAMQDTGNRACNVWTFANATCQLRRDGVYMPFAERSAVSGHAFDEHAWDQDVRLFEAHVSSMQHPSKCAGKARDWGGWNFGLGSQLHVMRNTMIFTLFWRESMVWGFHKTKYVSTRRCAAQDFSCLFKEVSGCSKEVTKETVLPPKFPSGHPEGPYDRICPGFTGSTFEVPAKMPGKRPVEFYASHLMRYIMRPNDDLAKFVLRIKKEIGFTADEPTIGVHVRHGDKKEGNLHTTAKYADALRCLAKMKGYKTVFVGSDDPKAVQELRAALPELKIIFIPNSYFEKDPTFYRVDKRAQKDGLGVFAKDAKPANNHAEWDEGMVFLTQLLLFSEADAFLGTMSSNSGRLVYELMYTKTKGMPFDVYDMDGNPYFMCSCNEGNPPFGDGWSLGGRRCKPKGAKGIKPYPGLLSVCNVYRPAVRSIPCEDPVVEERRVTDGWCHKNHLAKREFPCLKPTV